MRSTSHAVDLEGTMIRVARAAARRYLLPRSFPWHVRWRFGRRYLRPKRHRTCQGKLRGRRYRRAAARATRIIVPSRSTACDVERIYDVAAERIGVIHPAADPAFRPRGADDPIVREARHHL